MPITTLALLLYPSEFFMHTNRLICFGLIAIGLLTACKDTSVQGPSFDPSGTYTVSATAQTGPVRMFTQAGEVQNAAIIRHFYQRQYSWVFPSSGAVLPFQTAELTFTSPSEVTLNASTSMSGTLLSTSSPLTVSSQTSARVVLTAKNLVWNRFPANPNRCDNVWRDIPGVSTVYTCQTLAPGSGPASTLCEFKPVYVLNLHGKEARLATMSFIFSANANGRSCSMGSSDVFNVLNPTLPARLTPGDTLVVQEAEFPLVRK